MCEWNLIEFSCGHTQHVAGKWCPEYPKSQRRCPVHVTHYEYRGDEVCSSCRPKTQPSWLHNMFNQPSQRQQQSIGH
ncbi:hypothetical protein NKR23_g12098 [Pleurostoma richardsiae]|uniref:Uncharacterized protein n=1 Tax=Pleurostoma richardsiae TaxID=41990 RepID=A0AA38RFH3_9PEZI|nr:hypothetical protein NKR23_g12098 [Pleurostoma richardsiae]